MGLFNRKPSQTESEYGPSNGQIRQHGNGVVTVVYRRSDGQVFTDVKMNGQFLGSVPGDNRDGAIALFTS